MIGSSKKTHHLLGLLIELTESFSGIESAWAKKALEKSVFLLSKISLFADKAKQPLPQTILHRNQLITVKDFISRHSPTLSSNTQKLLELISEYETPKLDVDNCANLDSLKKHYQNNNNQSLVAYIDIKIFKDRNTSCSNSAYVHKDRLNNMVNAIDTYLQNCCNESDPSQYNSYAQKINSIFFINNYISRTAEILNIHAKDPIPSLKPEDIENICATVGSFFAEIQTLESSNRTFKNYFTYLKMVEFRNVIATLNLRIGKTKDAKTISKDIDLFLRTMTHKFYDLDNFQRYRPFFEDSFIGENSNIFCILLNKSSF